MTDIVRSRPRAILFCAVGCTASFLWCETNAETGCVGTAKEFTTSHEYSFNNTRRLGLRAGFDRDRFAVFADWDGDGDLDLALVSLSESIRFFDHSMNAITERPSPFVATPTCDVGDGIFLSSGFSMADWDGDGALDLIAATSAGAAICKQIDGALHLITDHPFTQIGTFEAISMVDWDKDGDLDLLVKRKHELICFEQENGGNIEHVLPVGRIWHFSVFDRDSVVDLLISRYPDGGARYFKQDGHLEELFEDYNPFEKILADYNPHGQLPLFALNDWTGDREVDFLLITTEKMRLYEQKQDRNLKALASRVLCPPSESFCKQGNCHPERRQCDCPPGIEGPQCTQCSMSKGRYSAECNKCPGHGSPNGTCQRRGMCQEIQEGIGFDNSQGIEGTAICMCFAPFFGKNCEEGSCPQGQFLHTDADIFLRSTWYPHWEACMPCAPGRFKAGSGNGACSDCESGSYQSELGQTDCDRCPPGRVAVPGQSECIVCPPGRLAGLDSCATCPVGHVLRDSQCIRCHNGTSPSASGTECVACDLGSVAEAGSGSCKPCPAGFVPDLLQSYCVACEPGRRAAERAENCSFCPRGSVPDPLARQCESCTGQLYAMPGDVECRSCEFPSMVMGQDRICSPLDPVLFLLGSIAVVVLIRTLCAYIQLQCLTSHLRTLNEIHDYEELHLVKASYFKYGIWRQRAADLIAESKKSIDSKSRRLGISLSFVLNELQGLYREKAHEVDWRWCNGEITRSGFMVKIREYPDVEDGADGACWDRLSLCPAPLNPSFYQLAGLLTFGPTALGKHKICPRDGRPDCSIVDALKEKSAPANWFLSWTWSYSLDDVCAALNRWWETHAVVAGSPQRSIYLWWCFFVNNQFRMLQDGNTEDTELLLEVFAKPLETAGKVLMCMDKFQDCAYTKRIWCIFEVFSAVRRSIPITLIMPGLDINQIHQPIVTVKELKSACHVNAEEAGASVKADEERIKAHILETMASFNYVNQTVEQALWIEIIKMMKSQSSTGMPDAIDVTDDISNCPDSPRAASRRHKL